MKKYQKILLSIFSVLLIAVIVFLILLFYQYPHYKEVVTPVNTQHNQTGIRVMSYNIRCFSPNDLGKRSWFYRADLIRQNIEKEQPTIIGFQEVAKVQYPYFKNILKEYDSVITYRDKSIAPEGCPLFYRKDLYKLKDKGSFWLSETPDEMSKDWGSACYRICSYVILTDIKTQKDFVVFNTHLDHISDKARINGINVVLDKIKEFGNLPSILMGDFNADEKSETYISATTQFDDSKYLTNNPDASATYQKWGKKLNKPCIDYIMISKDCFNVNDFKIVKTTFDGVYTSDHFPILTELEIK